MKMKTRMKRTRSDCSNGILLSPYIKLKSWTSYCSCLLHCGLIGSFQVHLAEVLKSVDAAIDVTDPAFAGTSQDSVWRYHQSPIVNDDLSLPNELLVVS